MFNIKTKGDALTNVSITANVHVILKHPAYMYRNGIVI